MVAMILPTALVGAISLFFVQKVVEHFETAIAEGNQEILPSLRLQSLMSMAVIRPNNYLATGDHQESFHFSHAAAQVDSAFDRLIQIPFGVQEEKRLVQEAFGSWIVSRQSAEALLRISEPVGNQEAARLMAVMDSYAMKAAKSLGTIFEIAQQERQTDLENTIDSYRRMKRSVFFLSVACIAAGAGVVILLGRHLSGSIRVLTEGAMRFGSGRLDHRIEIKTGDEMELLAEEFNRMAVILYEDQKILKHLAMHDGMTGLLNHKEFHRRLAEEFSRAQRHQRPLTLLMIDVDHFKKFNDAYGHPQGDKLLKLVSEAIKESVRQSDVVARYGGEEFAVLLVETPLPEATALGWRIQKRISELGPEVIRFLTGVDGTVTVSIGAAAYPDDAATAGDLVYLADQMLYKAKERGRNRVCTTMQDGASQA